MISAKTSAPYNIISFKIIKSDKRRRGNNESTIFLPPKLKFMFSILVLALSAIPTPQNVTPSDACCIPMMFALESSDQHQDHQPSNIKPIPMAEWPNYTAWPTPSTEPNLKNIKQLTFSGQNAEAYFNKKGDQIVFQTRQPEFPDEQIFTMNIDGSNRKLISTGLGRCTCSYFSPDGKFIYFSSTHEQNRGAQAPIDMSKGYVWKVNPQFSLYKRELATGKLEKVIDLKNYVAETTIDPNGKYMTFTANNGDVDIFRSDLDGKNIQPLVTTTGYDGGPFVSWDGKKIVYRSQPGFKTDQEKQEYLALLKEDMVRPSKMDIWIMNADGTGKKQVTFLPGASFAPFLHPDGKRIIFSSNYHDPKGREFDLFLINIDGTGLKQITHTPDFDGFPMFSRDGKKLIWASNRHGRIDRDTNVFICDWVN